MTWNALTLPWQLAFEQAWTAYCAGSLPIGSVVTDATGNVLAVGRNRLYETDAEPGLLVGNHLAHAEMNALAGLRGDAFDAQGRVVYSTMEPCPMCTGAIRMNGVSAVHYAARDPMAGSSELLEATEFMRRPRIQVSGPPSADTENVSIALNLAAFLAINPGRDQAARMVAAWESVAPDAVMIGQRLHEAGMLQTMCEENIPVSEVYRSTLKLTDSPTA